MLTNEGNDEGMNMTKDCGREGIRRYINKALQDSFNAGLTPCSHTTTTRELTMIPSLGIIVNLLKTSKKVTPK